MANIYRKYALRITKRVDAQTYTIWNYFDSKKAMLKDSKLYETGKAIAYIFSKDSYIILTNS